MTLRSGELGVAILAGGAGVRLRAASAGRPKALAPLGNGTLLDYQLARIAPLRPARVVLVLHHRAEEIRRHAGDRAEAVIEPAPLGTAGGLRLLPPGPTAWLTLNVDHVSDVDLSALVAGWTPPCTAVLAEAAVPVDEGVVTLDGAGRLVDWQERPVLRLPVTTGLYVFEQRALAAALAGEGALDMPALVRRLMPDGVHAWRHTGTWLDAGTPARLQAAARWLGQGPPTQP